MVSANDLKLGVHYMTRECYEDLSWMVFATVGVACAYLDEDKSKKMHQGRSGSDVCKHFFAKIRQVNSNPNPQQCREITSKISAQGAISSQDFMPKGRQNAAKAAANKEELLAPLTKKPRKSK